MNPEDMFTLLMTINVLGIKRYRADITRKTEYRKDTKQFIKQKRNGKNGFTVGSLLTLLIIQ